MEPQSDDKPHQCDIRECIEGFLNSFTPPLTAIIDPRVPRVIPQSDATLRQALRELVRDRAGLPSSSTHSLIVYELDDPGRRLLRFEIAGSQLGFTLPISNSPPVSSQPPSGELSILVAEDNVINQQLAVECLRSLGNECHLVGDGAAAVEAVRRRKYDIIFMDIHMPIMDGLEATRAIRGLPEGKHPYIAALTAYAMPGDKTRAFDAGMDDYISKPCRLENLSAILKKARARKF